MSEPGPPADFSGLVIALPDLDPNVTLLAPWIAPAEITEDDLRLVAELAKQWARFEVSFGGVRTFEPVEPGGATVHWLAPDPDEPFRQLIDDLSVTWPEYPPYQGAYGNDPTPHLTLANAALAEDELTAMLDDLAARLPVTTIASQLCVLEVIGGHCRVRASYSLAGESAKR